MTTTDTTIDFGPLLALRDEYTRSAPTCAPGIVAGDRDAIATGKALLAREERRPTTGRR